MRAFVTGATGALEGQLVPELVAAGHEVGATTETPGKVPQLRQEDSKAVIGGGAGIWSFIDIAVSQC